MSSFDDFLEDNRQKPDRVEHEQLSLFEPEVPTRAEKVLATAERLRRLREALEYAHSAWARMRSRPT